MGDGENSGGGGKNRGGCDENMGGGGLKFGNLYCIIQQSP
jgi:hypothetical protein